VSELKPADFDSADRLASWANELQTALFAPGDASRSYEVAVQAAVEPRGAGEGVPVAQPSRSARFVLRRREHGSASEKFLPREFFASAEYARLADLGRTLFGLIGEGAYVMNGDHRRDIGSFKEAITWLFDQARKGQSMQRYKGLGEMNPEQLWETTINPDTRRLLQVRIEDAFAADEIFTTLMGDQVEPRRDFIEKNALAVMNLDI
jgi:DNA gyrase subunit B